MKAVGSYWPPRRAKAANVPEQVRYLHELRKAGHKVFQGSATSKWVRVAGLKFYRQHFLMCLQVEKLAKKIKTKTQKKAPGEYDWSGTTIKIK